MQNEGQCENVNSHYVMALGSYRAFYILNWIYRKFTDGCAPQRHHHTHTAAPCGRRRRRCLGAVGGDCGVPEPSTVQCTDDGGYVAAATYLCVPQILAPNRGGGWHPADGAVLRLLLLLHHCQGQGEKSPPRSCGWHACMHAAPQTSTPPPTPKATATASGGQCFRFPLWRGVRHVSTVVAAILMIPCVWLRGHTTQPRTSHGRGALPSQSRCRWMLGWCEPDGRGGAFRPWAAGRASWRTKESVARAAALACVSTSSISGLTGVAQVEIVSRRRNARSPTRVEWRVRKRATQLCNTSPLDEQSFERSILLHTR
jgi:hypothetical protein